MQDENLPGRAEADRNRTVLIVEDEPIVRSLIVEVVSDLGYATIEAHDGRTGLAMLQKDSPIDLIITDLGLPDFNGRQIAEAGRVERPALKVLFVTGYDRHNATQEFGTLDPGMAILSKPFTIDQLIARVQALMKSEGEAKALPS